jgi:hypothetical protein
VPGYFLRPPVSVLLITKIYFPLRLFCARNGFSRIH